MKLLFSITVLLLISSVTALCQTVTGSGTVNYIPKFTGASTVGNSLIYDNGTNIGIGTTSPTTKFHVNGIGSFGGSVSSSNAPRAFNVIDVNAVVRVLRVDPASVSAPAVELISRTGPDVTPDVTYWDFYAQPIDKSFRIRDRLGGGLLDRLTISTGTGNVGIGTITPIGKLQVDLTNTNYTNTGGAGSHIVLNNPSTTGQNVVSSMINGSVVAKWRTDYLGNISSVAGTSGAHYFYTGGDFQTGTIKLYIANNGNVGIGTTSPGSFKLAVEGTIGARKVQVTQTTPWPDYVFQKNYQLPSLEDIEKYILINQHLPEMPSASDIDKSGVDLGNNQVLLLKKIEELTLYLIEQNKKIEEQGKKIEQLEKKLAE